MAKAKRRPRLVLIGIVIAVIAGGAAFYRYGGRIWHPVLVKIRGGRTTEEVLDEQVEAGTRLAKIVEAAGFDGYPTEVTLIALKRERTLEAWGRERDGAWRRLNDYPFTGFCGETGPKLRRGDRQIPEGIYGVEYLNPDSRYHLSLKVSYPNEFDRAKAREERRSDLGGDIMIHGGSATIGCIPIGNTAIEEVYALVATAGVRTTRIIIAPCDLRGGAPFPEAENVLWERQLYARIAAAMETFER